MSHHWIILSSTIWYALLVIRGNLKTILFHIQGRPVKRFGLPAFNALDSGILLSQGSLLFLKTQYFTNSSSCEKHHIQTSQSFNQTNKQTIAISRNFESSIAQLLQTHNDTRPCDTRDQRKRAKFMPFSPEKYLVKGSISMFSVFWRQNIFHSPIGTTCCSPDAIAFNGISPTKMYLTNYLLYHTAVFRNSPLRLGNPTS